MRQPPVGFNPYPERFDPCVVTGRYRRAVARQTLQQRRNSRQINVLDVRTLKIDPSAREKLDLDSTDVSVGIELDVNVCGRLYKAGHIATQLLHSRRVHEKALVETADPFPHQHNLFGFTR